MKRQKLFFNNALCRYNKYRRKLQRLVMTGENKHRQGVLRKHLIRLARLLNNLQVSIKRTAVLSGITAAVLLAAPQVNAQVTFEPFDPPFFRIPIDVGKYSAPTFVDVDGDSDLDVVIGDLYGTIKYYKNVDGVYTAQIGSNNPFGGIGVGYISAPTFVDVDDDGNLDVVIGESYGAIKYYKKNGDGDYIEQTGGNNPFAGIDVGFNSAPTFVDVDVDGNLDLVIGEFNGTIKYYKNVDGVYTAQIGSNNPFAGIDVGFNSTPTFVDVDGDSDLDVVIGERTGTIKYYKNDSGVYTAQTGTNNPFAGIDVGYNSAPTFVNIDGDSELDLVIGTQDGTINYYKNVSGVYTAQTGTDSPFAGIDVGLNSAPTFVDVDGDSDLDLVIGEGNGAIKYYKNVNGEYTAQTGTDNPFDGIDVGYRSTPTFVDVDDDGNLDVVIGERKGTINYYKNVDGVYTEQEGTVSPFAGIDVGTFSTPTFVDVDGDSDLDLVIGERTGTIKYYKNVDGVYTAQTGGDSPFAGIDVGYYSAPTFVDVDDDGNLDVVIGERDGTINYYKIVDGVYTAQTGGDSPFGGFDVGSDSTPTFVDLDGDGDMDLVSGNSDGILLAFENTTPNGLVCDGETKTWDGAAWSPVGMPMPTDNVIINADYDATDFTTSGAIQACTLTIDLGATVTIPSGQYVAIGKDITVNGALVVEHQGSVVQVEEDATVTNNGTIVVNVTSATLAARDVMGLGSPVTNAAPVGVDNPIFRKLEHTTANFRPNPDVQLLYTDGTNFVDEEAVGGGPGDDWATQSGDFTVAKGYYVMPQPSLQAGGEYPMTFTQDATQVGTLNTGTIVYPLTFNEAGTGTGTPVMNKNASPNFISNPYPSAISAQAFLDENDAVDEVYFWEHNTAPSSSFPGSSSANFSMADISVFNSTGFISASTGSPIEANQEDVMISTAQGFGIKNNGTSPSVTFKNSMRSTTGNTTLRSSLNANRVWLDVKNETYNLGNTTLIGFIDNATAGFDASYDSPRLGAPVSIHSHLVDGSEALAIQGREAFDSAMVVGLGFSSLIEENTANYRISLAQLQGGDLENSAVFLRDVQTGAVTNLKETAYSFTSAAGTFNNRFEVFFEEASVLNTSDTVLSEIKMYPNPATGVVNIANPAGRMIANISVRDMLGRVLISKDVNATNRVNTLDVSALRSAAYIVMITENGTTTAKQLIKE